MKQVGYDWLRSPQLYDLNHDGLLLTITSFMALNMRSAVSSIFLFLYLVALIKPIQPLIEYHLRYEYFAKKLCLNLDRPEMKCNGKCILMQRLKKASQEATNIPATPTTSSVNLKDYPVGFMCLLTLPENKFISISTLTGYVLKIYQPVTRSIFRPPA